MTVEHARILVIDDQPEVLESIELTLQSQGFQIMLAPDGTQALTMLQSQHVDLIISDIAMPGMNGYQLYEQIRSYDTLIDTPFIFLTARALDSDIRYGKELGVDDYLVKPISRDDLLAAIKGKLRRAHQLRHGRNGTAANVADTEATFLSIGRLALDTQRYQAWYDGQLLQLAAREFAMLAYLARNHERVIPHQELIRETHNLTMTNTEASELLRPLVRTLRRKLGCPVGDIGCIESVRGIGYRLTI